MSLVSVTRPDGSVDVVEMNDAVLAHCADADGRHLGLVALAEGMIALPAPPPDTDLRVCRWDAQAGRWRHELTFAGRKAAKWDEIKAARAAAEFGGFAWDGSIFDCDELAQSRIQGGVLLAMQAEAVGAPFEIDWTLADNTVRTLAGAGMIAAGLAMGGHVSAQHEIARALRAAIDAALTAEQLEAVIWPA